MNTATTPTPQNKLREFFNRRQCQRNLDLTEATTTYRDLVQALATGSDPPLGADDVTDLLTYLGKTDCDLAADSERAIAFGEHAALEASQPALAEAQEAASLQTLV
ncbi:MAG: hypothetical protein ABGZ53_37010 [Fuerstiella sp.]